MSDNIQKSTIKERLLNWAEIIDAYRIVPRIFLLIYGTLVYNLYVWYTSIETVTKVACDSELMRVLLESGESTDAAQIIACQASSIIGGPTTEQTLFVTTIVGLSAAVFAFYTNSGRSWSSKSKNTE